MAPVGLPLNDHPQWDRASGKSEIAGRIRYVFSSIVGPPTMFSLCIYSISEIPMTKYFILPL